MPAPCMLNYLFSTLQVMLIWQVGCLTCCQRMLPNVCCLTYATYHLLPISCCQWRIASAHSGYHVTFCNFIVYYAGGGTVAGGYGFLTRCRYCENTSTTPKYTANTTPYVDDAAAADEGMPQDHTRCTHLHFNAS